MGHPVYRAKITRTWICPIYWQPAWFFVITIGVNFLPKSICARSWHHIGAIRNLRSPKIGPKRASFLKQIDIIRAVLVSLNWRVEIRNRSSHSCFEALRSQSNSTLSGLGQAPKLRNRSSHSCFEALRSQSNSTLSGFTLSTFRKCQQIIWNKVLLQIANSII